MDERIVVITGDKGAVICAHLLLVQIVAAMPPDNGSRPSKRQMASSLVAPQGFPGLSYGSTPNYGPPQGFAPPPPAQGFGGLPSYTSPTAYGGQPGYSQQQLSAPQYGAPPHQPYSQPQPDAGPAPPPATMEQLVTQDQAGKLIGRGGQGIKELREMSRAKVRVESDCEPGTEWRKVTVTGTTDEIQMVLSLIQQRLGAPLGHPGP